MKLYLYWKDIEKKNYKIGCLTKEDNGYHFDVYKEEYKNAKENGCPGIGNLSSGNTSDHLFGFFKNRIPPKCHPRAEILLKYFSMDEYDDMKLLEATKGLVVTDRFFCLTN